MGSSYIEYRGYGFWSRDSFVEQVAGDVAAAIEGLPAKELWLSQLAAHWKLQASGVFGGCLHLKIDEFASTEPRRLTLRELVQASADRRDHDDLACQTALLLLRLLDGELTTTAASPLDYMVGAPKETPRNVEEEIGPSDPDAALKRRANEGSL